MENNNKNDEIIITKSLMNRVPFENFKNLCISYSNILSKIYIKNNNFFSKEDIIIINAIINEIINYSKELLKNNLINESKDIINLGISITDNFYNIHKKYFKGIKIFILPLKLKLYILEANFNLNFKYIKDYINSENILLKIIDIQKILQLSNFNIGSSYFYLGIIYFFTKKFELSEKVLKISQKLSTPLEFELNNEHFLIKKREFDIPEKNEKNQIIPYKISLKKSSDILRVLAEIYLLKKEYIKAINCIENAYYLYFESYGSNYGYTIFLRNKIISIFELIKKYLPIDNKSFINYENNKMTNSSNIGNFLPYKNDFDNKVIKGKNKYFVYKIENTLLYQPLIISIYSLDNKNINHNNGNNDNYISKSFIKTFYFNKNKLLDYFGEENANNSYFYLNKNYLKIINSFEFKRNKIYINNKKLKSCLMWNNK